MNEITSDLHQSTNTLMNVKLFELSGQLSNYFVFRRIKSCMDRWNPQENLQSIWVSNSSHPPFCQSYLKKKKMTLAVMFTLFPATTFKAEVQRIVENESKLDRYLWERRDTKTNKGKNMWFSVIWEWVTNGIVETITYANYYLSAAWPIFPGQRQRNSQGCESWFHSVVIS